MALNSLICADVPLRNCSLAHSLTHLHSSAHMTMVLPRTRTSFRNKSFAARDRACGTLCRLLYNRWWATDSL